MLISIAMVAYQRRLALLGGGRGIIGALLTVNGFFLIVQIPWLA